VFCPQAKPDLFSDSDFAFLLTNFKKIFIDFTSKLGSLRGPRQQLEKAKRSQCGEEKCTENEEIFLTTDQFKALKKDNKSARK